jgi:hypothetical protein
MPQQTKPRRVFISHSSKDKEFVHKLVVDLRRYGVELWLDEEQILVGESITEKIAEGLAECEDLIIVLSEHFLGSPWCKTELRTVLHKYIKTREKRILPLEIETLPDWVWSKFPLIFMEDIRRVDLRDAVYQQHLYELLSAFGYQDQHLISKEPHTPLTKVIETVSDPDNIKKIFFRDQGIMYTFSFESILDKQPSLDKLAFLTEEEAHYVNFRTGSCVNFSLRNLHARPVTVYALGVEIIKFFDTESKPFLAFSEIMPTLGLGASAPIPVYMLRVELASETSQCRAAFIFADDSAESRGLLFRGQSAGIAIKSKSNWSRLISLVKGKSELDPSRIADETNAILPTTRFALGPGEADAFHCQLSSEVEGLFWYRFIVSFHFDDQNRLIYSDRVFPCFCASPKPRSLWG